MTLDYEGIEEGDEWNGHIKNFQVTIKRMPYQGHLCGYVDFRRRLSRTEYQKIHSVAHGGITFIDGTVYGFDCAHSGDFIPGMENLYAVLGIDRTGKSNVYRDKKYVLSVLENMINQLDVSI